MNKQHTYTVKEEDLEIDETEDEDNHKKNISRRLNNENNLRARQRAKIHNLDNDNTENIEYDDFNEFDAENIQDPDNEVYKQFGSSKSKNDSSPVTKELSFVS